MTLLRRALVAPALAVSLAATALAATTGSPAAATDPTAISYDDFSSVDGVSLVADAVQVGDRVQLTPSETGTKGALWSTQTIDPDQDFATDFVLDVHDFDSSPIGAADGLGFVVHTDPRGTSAIGSEGGLLGFGGLPYPGYDPIKPSFATAFVTFAEPAVKYVKNGDVYGASPMGWNRTLGGSDPALSGAGPVHAWIDYVAASDRMRLYLSAGDTKPSVPLLDATVDLAGIVGVGPAVVGLTAATGGAYSTQDVLSWHLASGPGVVQEPQPATPTSVRITPAGPAAYGTPMAVKVRGQAAGPLPTGSVTLTDGDRTVASGTLTKGKLVVPAAASLPVGDHHLVATYTSDVPAFADSSVETDQVITPASSTTALTATQLRPTATPRVLLVSAVRIAGSIKVPVSGSVTFYDGATALGDPVPLTGVRHVARMVYPLAEGEHTITAVYQGSDDVLGSASGPAPIHVAR